MTHRSPGFLRDLELSQRLDRQQKRGGGFKRRGTGSPRRENTRITPLTGAELFQQRFSQPGAPALIEAEGYPRLTRDRLGREYFIYRGLDRRAAAR